MSNIYGQFIEKDKLSLCWSDTPVLYEPWVLAKSPVDGAQMKQEFQKDFGGGRIVEGWIGMLDSGSAKYGGFSLYQNMRMVKGYPGVRFKPVSVFAGEGQGSNDLVNQRLVGRLNFTGFDVSHTKDDIDFAVGLRMTLIGLAKSAQYLKVRPRQLKSLNAPKTMLKHWH